MGTPVSNPCHGYQWDKHPRAGTRDQYRASADCRHEIDIAFHGENSFARIKGARAATPDTPTLRVFGDLLLSLV